MKKYFTGILIIIAIVSCQTKVLKNTGLYSFPKAEGIVIDGSIEEWTNKGLLIPLIANNKGIINHESFSSKVSMTWDQNNFYFFAEITDDSIFQDKATPTWKNDGIELFISSRKGSEAMLQYLILPSITKGVNESVVNKLDYRTGVATSNVKDLKMVSKLIPNGYRVEIGLPFSALNLKPQNGDTIAFNFYISDADGLEKCNKYSWHYNSETYLNHDALYELILTDNEQQQTVPLVKAYLEDTTNYIIKIITLQKPETNKVSLTNEKEVIATSVFEKIDDVYISNFRFDKSLAGSKYPTLIINTNYQPTSTIEWIDIPFQYTKMLAPNQFEQEIQLFAKIDKKEFPPKNAILFVGSSSIRLWKSLKEDFKEVQVINRGFGGSKTNDLLYFFDRIVKPYQPKTIVYYAGTNDLASGELPQTIANNVEQFIKNVKRDLPLTKVFILSNTMAVSRKHLSVNFNKTNELIQIMIKKYDNSQYVDVSKVIMDKKGVPKPELFLADSTHLNANGYKLWTEVLRPILLNK